MRIAFVSLLTILCLMLAVTPAMADSIIYENGPINGTTDAWTISEGSGYSVSDSFIPNFYNVIVEGLNIGVWLSPGDSVSSVEMQVGSNPFGNDIYDQVLYATGFTDLGINQYGYDLQQVNFRLYVPLFNYPPPPTLWVTLSNANATNGDVVYWDENSGIGCYSYGCPSLAYQTSTGSIPSEAFTITGEFVPYVPEPSSIMLFGSGILGLAGLLRYRFNR